MKTSFKSRIASLGTLRLGLIIIAMVNMLLPVIDSVLRHLTESDMSGSLWYVFPTLVAPVMAPLLLVILFFDYLMSRIQAADAQGETRDHYIAISRIELMVMAIMFLYWLPFFITMLN
jgi:hypothetical protein